MACEIRVNMLLPVSVLTKDIVPAILTVVNLAAMTVYELKEVAIGTSRADGADDGWTYGLLPSMLSHLELALPRCCCS